MLSAAVLYLLLCRKYKIKYRRKTEEGCKSLKPNNRNTQKQTKKREVEIIPIAAFKEVESKTVVLIFVILQA
jgi:hypothetical protein